MKHVDVAVAVVLSDSKVLIARRKSGGKFGGYWEFPGGKCEAGESAEDCVCRELLEELAIAVHPVLCFTPLVHSYGDLNVRLHPFLCTHEGGDPTPISCDEIRWVEPADLRSFKFPEANGPLIEQVIQYLPTPSRHLIRPARDPGAQVSTVSAFT